MTWGQIGWLLGIVLVSYIVRRVEVRRAAKAVSRSTQ